MGKGKKGGSGGHMYRSDGQNENKKASCSETLLTVFIISGLLVSFFTHILFDRTKKIRKYNSYAGDWAKTDYSLFQNEHFTLNNGQDYLFLPNTEMIGSYWPVRDTCHYWGDTLKGCIPVKPYSYIVVLPPYKNSTISFYHNDVLINKLKIPLKYVYSITESKSNCLNSTLDECKLNSDSLKETTNATLSNRVVYLNGVCILLTRDDFGRYTFHNRKKKSADLMDSGCYDNFYDIAEYSGTYTPNITFELRYKTDPYSAASIYTSDCSREYPNSTKCFGETLIEANTGLFIACCVYYILYNIMLIGICILCKVNNKSK